MKGYIKFALMVAVSLAVVKFALGYAGNAGATIKSYL